MLVICSGVGDQPNVFGVGEHAIEVIRKNSVLSVYGRHVESHTQSVWNETITMGTSRIKIIIEVGNDDIIKI